MGTRYAADVSAARRTLDRIHSLAQLEELARAPHAYATTVAEHLDDGETFEASRSRDAALTAALVDLDAFATRAMKLCLAHALADDTSLAPATRNVFAATVTSYENRLDVLEQRVLDLASRGGAPEPRDVADRLLDATRRVLALRAELRSGVLALVREQARASIPHADARARDRKLDDPSRKRWSALRRDLEMIAEEPGRLLVAPLDERIAAWPEQLDEPAPEPERSFADFIELD